MQTLKIGFGSLTILVSAVLLSCATTQKGKYLESIIIGTSLGAIYGASRSDYKQQNAMLFGSMGGLIGTSVAAVMDDRDREIEKLQAKLSAFSELQSSIEIQPYLNAKQTFSKDEIIYKGSTIQKSDKIPAHLKQVLTQGDVIGIKTDQWMDYGSNRAAHVDEIWEFTNPEFKLKRGKDLE